MEASHSRIAKVKGLRHLRDVHHLQTSVSSHVHANDAAIIKITMSSKNKLSPQASVMNKASWRNPVMWLIGICLASFIAAIGAEVARDWLPAVDGPYQTINACRRVMDGQWPGEDFVVFHGIGTIWYHSIFYAILGGNLSGSIAAYLAACFAIVWVPSALAARYAGYPQWLAAALGLLVVNVLLVTPGPLYDVVYPGGNMLGTRIGLSLTVVMIFAFLLRRMHSRRGKSAVLGAGAAIGFWISQEQGMSMSASLLALGLWLVVTKRVGWREFGVDACTALVSLIVVYVSGLSLLSGGGIARVLDFSWIQIPDNQFWFFGKPPRFINSARDLLDAKDIMIPAAFALSPWIGAFIASFMRRNSPSESERALTILLMAYALFSLHPLAGYKSAHYFASMGHAGFVVLLLKSRGCWEWANKRLGERKLMYALVAMGCLCLGLELAKNQLRSLLGKEYLQAKAVVYQKNDAAFVGMSAEVKEAERIQRFAQSIGPNGRLWSTFAGPEEEALGCFLPARYDYIIYALTEESKNDYLMEFHRYDPTHVITGRESTGAIFQWMAKCYWDFHREILRAYEPVAAVQGRVLWSKRKHAPEQLAEQSHPFSCESANPQQAGIVFSTVEKEDEVGVYEVRLKYRLNEDPVPFLSRRLSRISVLAEGVPQWQQIGIRVKQYDASCEFRFPVIRRGSNEPVKINLQSLSPFGAPNLVIEKVELVRLSGYTQESALVLQNDSLITPSDSK
jgi:hypothetical protein